MAKGRGKHQHRGSGASRMRRKGSPGSAPGEKDFIPLQPPGQPSQALVLLPALPQLPPAPCWPSSQTEFPADPGVPGTNTAPHPFPRAESVGRCGVFRGRAATGELNRVNSLPRAAEYRGRTTFCFSLFQKQSCSIPADAAEFRIVNRAQMSYSRSHLRELGLELEIADSLFIQTLSTGLFS